MTLAETLDRVNDARKVDVWTSRFTASKDELDSIFTNMETTAAKYGAGSDERTEIETKISQGKTILQNMLDAH